MFDFLKKKLSSWLSVGKQKPKKEKKKAATEQKKEKKKEAKKTGKEKPLQHKIVPTLEIPAPTQTSRSARKPPLC